MTLHMIKCSLSDYRRHCIAYFTSCPTKEDGLALLKATNEIYTQANLEKQEGQPEQKIIAFGIAGPEVILPPSRSELLFFQQIESQLLSTICGLYYVLSPDNFKSGVFALVSKVALYFSGSLRPKNMDISSGSFDSISKAVVQAYQDDGKRLIGQKPAWDPDKLEQLIKQEIDKIERQKRVHMLTSSKIVCS